MMGERWIKGEGKGRKEEKRTWKKIKNKSRKWVEKNQKIV